MKMDRKNKVQWTDELEKYHLLKHPFYQAWNEGRLTVEDLKIYARQYFHHVNAFPRYLSTIHAGCEDLATRQVLLDNLVDEEKGERNHPELWLRFAEGLGETREAVKSQKPFTETKALMDCFFECAQASTAEGIGALHAYENQVPEVAESKIKGLVEQYQMSDERALDFFKEHIGADEWHSEETARLIEALPDDEKAKAKNASLKAAKALWRFLDGVQREITTECKST